MYIDLYISFKFLLVMYFFMSKQLVKRAINNHYQNVDWKVSVIIDVLHCLDGQTDVGLDRDQLSLILNHVCTDR